jgi:uncharacterized membrane protein
VTDIDRLAQRVDQLEGIVRALYPLVQELQVKVQALSDGGDRAGSAAPTSQPHITPPPPATSAPGWAASATTGTPHAPAPSASAHERPLPPSVRTPPPTAHGSPLSYITAARALPISLEDVVGRYGALGLAGLSILLGIGAFVRWAIARGFLGPAGRVMLGLLAAALVAGLGLWLRERGSRFGHVLLALALAIVHVDAWAAGPLLQLVTSPTALGAAAIASAALAWLALGDGEATTFSVGVGGALVAPFVTASGEPHVIALLVFGYVVIAVSVWAVRDHGWDFPIAILALGAILYTSVAARVPPIDSSAPIAYLPAAFALACATTALFVLPAKYRATLAQGALIGLWNALRELVGRGSPASLVGVAAAVGAIVAFTTVPALGDAMLRILMGACALPLLLLGIAVWAAPPVALDRGLVTAAWAIGTAVAAAAYAGVQARATTGARDSALVAGESIAIMMAGLEGAAAIAIAFGEHHPIVAIVALAVYAAALSLIAATQRWASALVPVFVGLTAAALWSGARLAMRTDFTYTPFLTPASLAAAASTAGWLVAATALARTDWASSASPGVAESDRVFERQLVWFVAFAVLFLWIRQELIGAASADVATFLLILYYAVAGVSAVLVGRARANAPARGVGLAIAVYAAIKAVIEAAHLGVGLRVASYLAAGLFLLAISYWYRAG